MPKPLMEMQVRRRIPEIDWTGVPPGYLGRVSAVCRSLADCQDLVHWFGDSKFCPYLPIFLMVPGTGGISLVGMGFADAAELQDDAVAIWTEKSALMAKQGSLGNFDELREKHGLMERSKVREATREAFWERIKAHKASPVTDPFRVPQYVRVNGKTVHAVAKPEEMTT